MKFAVETVSKCSGRIGVISNVTRIPDATFKTPLVMMYTKSGSVPYLGADTLKNLNNTNPVVQISIATMESMEAAVKIFEGPIDKYIGLSNSLIFATVKDAGELTPTGFHEKDRLPLFTRSGRLGITAERYMDIMETFKPDIYQVLCDGDTNTESSKKRVLNSVERSEQFLEKCVRRHRDSSVLNNSMLIGCIVGGFDYHLRKRSTQNVLSYNEIDGFLIDGLHNNGSSASYIDSNKLLEIVENISKELPSDKLKMVVGAYNPLDVLKLIKLGVDLFDSSYPYIKSQNNFALTFNFHLTKPKNPAYSINLADKIYCDDFQPIQTDCNCFTCTNHTRAYLHHLIATKELLAPILLTLHNHHRYYEFFDEIRKCIADDSTDELIKMINLHDGCDIASDDKIKQDFIL